jgi:hypothetical protein
VGGGLPCEGMGPLSLFVGTILCILGGVMCLDLLSTGEGNPIPAVLILGAGILVGTPGLRWAQTQDWPRHD